MNYNHPAIQNLTLIAVFIIAFFYLNSPFEEQKNDSLARENKIVAEQKIIKPKIVRGIYLTANSAGSDNFRKEIIASLKDSKINSVVIDIKDYSGYILYQSELKELKDIDAVKATMPDLKKIITEFHAIGIYVIARQTVFQDPVLALAKPELAVSTKNGNIWYDNKGLAWVNPSKQEVWNYNLAIAKEAVNFGFDEINFDYMRYPSDGNMSNIYYDLPEGKNKSQVLADFFKFLSDNLSGQAKISIDTFGLVLDHTGDDYDLGIGQILNSVVDHFDYVCPMMYPSHYPLTYLGYENSAEHPGEVIAYGLKISHEAMLNKRAKLRPWLQAFNLRAIYDQNMIEAQEQAVENATSTDGWILWNARNYYPAYIFKK
ncbi:MAG: putative glycoside hydrolase [bacterium]|nr:putative glycoside hydrolase [bacterium]